MELLDGQKYTTHHFRIGWFAEHPGVRFTRYAVLGDDVLIADTCVSQVYEQLISHSGSAEFAKRFRVRGLSVDPSPISIANLVNSHHLCLAIAPH
ncbi:hypothetical protein BDE02_T000500 [Populus trichocarpa]|nr:hypothetical protein BDE02_T000500 [Populus trichocarpa]